MLKLKSQNKRGTNKKVTVKELGSAVLLTLGIPDRTFTEPCAT